MQLVHEVVTGVVKVTGDGGRAERGGVRKHLLDTVRFARVRAGRVAEVEGAGSSISRGDALDLEDLACRCAVAHVAERRADADRARGEARIEHAQDLVALVEVRAGMGPARLVRAAMVHGLRRIDRRDAVEHQGTREFVAAGTAIVDLVGPGALCVPVIHHRSERPDLEVHNRRSPVEQCELVAHGPGPVKMRVDEAGRDDMAAGVDLAAALERFDCDSGDPTRAHADICDLVKPGLGVHHPPAKDHEVEWLPRLRQGSTGGPNGGRTCDNTKVELPAGDLVLAHVVLSSPFRLGDADGDATRRSQVVWVWFLHWMPHVVDAARSVESSICAVQDLPSTEAVALVAPVIRRQIRRGRIHRLPLRPE